MAKKNYNSMFFPQERWVDNRELYKAAIAKNDNFICSKKHAVEMLLFSERFPPDKKHDRTIAQAITVALIKNPSWSFKHRINRKKLYEEFREEFTFPTRGSYKLEKIVEVDFGIIAKQICYGAVSNYSPYPKHLDVKYDPKDLAKGIDGFVQIKLMPCSYEAPILFGVRDYVMIDGEIAQENYFIHLPIFEDGTYKFVGYKRNSDNQQKLLRMRIKA